MSSPVASSVRHVNPPTLDEYTNEDEKSMYQCLLDLNGDDEVGLGGTAGGLDPAGMGAEAFGQIETTSPDTDGYSVVYL